MLLHHPLRALLGVEAHQHQLTGQGRRGRVEPVPEVVVEEKKADKKTKKNAKIEEIKPVEVTPPPVEVPVDPRMKLFQNFQDLRDAVENKNKEYFGVEDSVKI